MQWYLPASAIMNLKLLTLSFIANKLLETSGELTNFCSKWETSTQGGSKRPGQSHRSTKFQLSPLITHPPYFFSKGQITERN